MWFKREVDGDGGLFWLFSFQYRVSCLLNLPQLRRFPVFSLSFLFDFLVGHADFDGLTSPFPLHFPYSSLSPFIPPLCSQSGQVIISPFSSCSIRLSTSTCTIVLYSSPLLYMYLLILYWCSLISVPLYIVHYIA